jgi:hypothetical protein
MKPKIIVRDTRIVTHCNGEQKIKKYYKYFYNVIEVGFKPRLNSVSSDVYFYEFDINSTDDNIRLTFSSKDETDFIWHKSTCLSYPQLAQGNLVKCLCQLLEKFLIAL